MHGRAIPSSRESSPEAHESVAHGWAHWYPTDTRGEFGSDSRPRREDDDGKDGALGRASVWKGEGATEGGRCRLSCIAGGLPCQREPRKCRAASDAAVRHCVVQSLLHVASTLVALRYCAFNGGGDAWVDVGNKCIGMQTLQAFLKVSVLTPCVYCAPSS